MSILDEHNKALPYGSIPYIEILSKLEETDMNISNEDVLHNYNEYMRDEITDWTLEKPYLESDSSRRNPDISRTILNVHHNGTRGQIDYPQHPDMFYGFMDHDNRGLDNNPRMNEYNNQIKTRMPNLEIRMGNNSTDTDTQSPWTNQSLSRCRRDMQTSLAYNTKIFTNERDNMFFNRNTVTANIDPRTIHGDPLPETSQNEQKVSTTIIGNNVSDIHRIKQEGELLNSFINREYTNTVPKNQRYDNVKNDHEAKEQYESNAPNQFALGLKNIAINKHDQEASISYNNYQRSQNTNPIQIKINNTQYDTQYNTQSINPSNKSNLLHGITNPNYISNDLQIPITFTNNQIRTDQYNRSNAMEYITADVYDPVIQSQSNIGKNKIQNSIPSNNLTIIDVPDYRFNENILGIHCSLVRNNNIQLSDNTIPNTYQIESVNNNNYRFNDNILINMLNTITNVMDKTSETQLKPIGNPMQEHRVKNMQFDNSWKVSAENVTSKSQKQVRTSGTNDPTLYHIKDSNDFESINGGNVLGNKCIRGDYMENDNSTVNDRLDIN